MNRCQIFITLFIYSISQCATGDLTSTYAISSEGPDKSITVNFYIDADRSVSAKVTSMATGDGPMVYSNENGTLLMEEKGMNEPCLLLRGVIDGEWQVRPASITSCTHILSPIEADTVEEHDYQVIEDDGQPPFRSARMGRSFDAADVYPEILVIVEYSLHEALGGNQKKTEQYVTTFMSAVNPRFKELIEPRVEISIADIRVSKSESDTPFIYKNRVGRDAFDADSALHDLGEHLAQQPGDLESFDLALVLTSQDMCRFKNGKCSRSTAGYAYIGGACVKNSYLKKINSVALVEDSGGFSGVVVAAHEIGHLLGAAHDGQPSPRYLSGPSAVGCSWNDGYIMSDMRRTKRGLQWSACSKRSIKHFTSSLTASCLMNRPRSRAFPLLTWSQLGRATTSLDDQCLAEAGTRACFTDSRVCSQLFCLNPDTGTCISYRPAVEGSECDGDGTCRDGVCVKASKEEVERVNNPWDQLSNRVLSGGNRLKSQTSSSFDKHQSSTESPNIGSISSTQKIVTDNKTVTEAAKAIENDEECMDNLKGNGKGELSCTQLYHRFGHIYCRNKQMILRCCASHKSQCATS